MIHSIIMWSQRPAVKRNLFRPGQADELKPESTGMVVRTLLIPSICLTSLLRLDHTNTYKNTIGHFPTLLTTFCRTNTTSLTRSVLWLGVRRSVK
uniref:Uncharacterized protein n=1 Tax=Anguilla anguilla TaxID=7936 RepID=A0A0E9U4Q3_ANGAN